MVATIAGVVVPDSPLAREATALARDAGCDQLLGHAQRVYLFAALQGRARGLAADPELLLVGAMTHDLGLTHRHGGAGRPDEVAADVAAALLRSHGRDDADARGVSLGIVLSALVRRATTADLPALPDRVAPETALLVAGVEGDLLGRGLDRLRPEAVAAVLAAYPRPAFGRLAAVPPAGERARPDGCAVPRGLLAHLQGCPLPTDGLRRSRSQGPAAAQLGHRWPAADDAVPAGSGGARSA